MARHNRDARGEDQRGKLYEISYQPDWLKQIKVTRDLESGRQSTKTLFRNSVRAEQEPGTRVRTRLSSPDQKLDFAVELDDPQGVITRVIIETALPTPGGADCRLVFSIEDRNSRRGKRPQR
jgi:hypothetical protein